MKLELGSISKISIVHVQITNDKMYYHYLQLKKVKDDIVLGKRGERYTDFDELIKQIKKENPVLLHFSGKGILNRNTDFKENYRRTILLNGNIEGFYFTDYIEDKTVFSSVIRRDVVDNVLSDFMNQKLHILAVSSGPFISSLIVPIIKKESIIVTNYLLRFENEKLNHFEKDQTGLKKPILLGDDNISYNLIPCAGLGVQFFNPSDKIILPNNESVFELNIEEAKQKNLFKRFGIGIMIVFLIVLSANYFYLGHLNQVVIDNTTYLQDYDEQLNSIAKLKDEKTRKESLLKSSGVTNNGFLSFYLMEIGNSIPSEIILERLVVRPILKDVKRKEKIEFDDKKIQIFGRTNSSKGLNDWIKEMEDKIWVSSVDIDDYEFIDSHGAFELEMIID